MNADSKPLLRMRAIGKSFGGVPVLNSVNFEVCAGEVHALCGENGAGKSTLMNILAGIHQPDSGEIELDGRIVGPFSSAHQAQGEGVGIVFQERSLFGPLSVAENIFAGRQPVTAWGMIDSGRLNADAARILQQVAPDVSPQSVVADLTPAQQQMVEIAKALSLEARILVFDEPTAALTETETRRLFEVIKDLRQRGVGIVYISHRLEEIFHLADRVTVLKDGAGQGTLPVAETNTDDLIRLMVGRDLEKPSGSNLSTSAPILLEVRGWSDPESRGGVPALLHDVTFQARAGEIVGLAGLAGAGRTETALSLFGARPRGTGELLLEGQCVQLRRPSEAIAAGLGYVSEDRKEAGLFLEMSVRENVSVGSLSRFGTFFFRSREEARVVEEFRDRLRIQCRSIGQEVARLSGGNQQKVLLARWLLVNPRVLIVDEPTRGVDVGAKREVHQLLRDFANAGRAVIMISSDLPEVLSVSDRIYVVREGRIAGELPRAEWTEEAVMRLAAKESTRC